MVLILIAPTHCTHLPFKSSLSGAGPSAAASDPCCWRIREGEAGPLWAAYCVRIPWDGERIWNSAGPRAGWLLLERLCLSWCLSLVLGLMDGWASRTALIMRNTQQPLFAFHSVVWVLFLDSCPFRQGWCQVLGDQELPVGHECEIWSSESLPSASHFSLFPASCPPPKAEE